MPSGDQLRSCTAVIQRKPRYPLGALESLPHSCRRGAFTWRRPSWLKAAQRTHLGTPRHHPGGAGEGGSNKRVSLAALIAVKPGCRPRLIYRVHRGRRGKDQRKGFTEADYAALLDAAHQQLASPLVVVWDNLKSHVSAAMTELIVARD
jgi:hypothetical protein